MFRQEPLKEFFSNVSDRANRSFVESEEFCRLLLGKRKLVRCDQAHGDVRGLMDVETGECYFIEQEKLFPPE